jgi:protein-S-isoprenylcysteine O-methyltransferase Ste14
MTRKSIVLRSRGFAETHNPAQRGLMYRLRNVLPIPIVLLIALWSRPGADSLWRGAICLLLGELIRWWSAGHRPGLESLLKQGRMVTKGPYGLVRRPDAWGTSLVGLGIAVMSEWWPAYLMLAGLAALRLRFVHPVEEAQRQQEYGEAYGAYCQAVPEYIPSASHFLQWYREARRKPREVEERFGAREAFLAEGSMFMVLLGVVAAMIVQWLF